MEKDQLKDLENESKELMELLKATRDIENSALDLPPVDAITTRRKKSYTMRRVSAWWVAAALFVGVFIGNLTNHTPKTDKTSNYATLYADTCRSLADGDVNLALLITHL
jgi:hypothetical protein